MKTLLTLFVLAFALASATPAFSIIADAGGPYSFYLGDVLTLDASGSTPSNCSIPDASYNWDLDNNGSYDLTLGYLQAVVNLNPADYASFFSAAGVYPIALYYSALMDCEFCGWEYGNDMTTVTVLEKPNGVPEPATMLLLSSGLLGLWGFRRKFIK